MDIILETVLKPLENGRHYIKLDNDLIRNEEIKDVQRIRVLNSELYYNIDGKLIPFTNFVFYHNDGTISDTYLHRSEAVNQLDYLVRRGQTTPLYYKHSALPIIQFIQLHSDELFILTQNALVPNEAKERKIWKATRFKCLDILCADINTKEPTYLFFLAVDYNNSDTYDETIILTMRQLNEIALNINEGNRNIHISPYSVEENNILNYCKNLFILPNEASLSKCYKSYHYKRLGDVTEGQPIVYIARQEDLIRCLPTIFYINNALLRV